jgi:lipopolysaccharide assembly outer membrane protein LptD (OstA)
MVVAQQAEKPPAEPKYTEIKYSADTSSYRWEGDDRVIALKGNVKFTQGDTTVTADKVDYRESTKTAQMSGNLKITDPQSTTTGDTCTVNFEQKKATLTGNVRMAARPKPRQAEPADAKVKPLKAEWKDEMVVTCDKIDYFYKEKRAESAGNLKIMQKDRVITADAATYLGKEEIVKLSGNIQAKDEKKKHTFSAPKVTVSLKDGDEWIEAENASGTFYVKDEEAPEAAQ